MFDRYFVSRPADTHIKIEQKPHDSADAARLYGELRATAEQEVSTALVDRFGADNELTIILVNALKSYETEERQTRVIFRLAGKKYDFTVKGDDPIATRREFLQRVAYAITEEAMRQLTNKAGLPYSGQ